jgi:hypothetical protein
MADEPVKEPIRGTGQMVKDATAGGAFTRTARIKAEKASAAREQEPQAPLTKESYDVRKEAAAHAGGCLLSTASRTSGSPNASTAAWAFMPDGESPPPNSVAAMPEPTFGRALAKPRPTPRARGASPRWSSP